MTDQIVGVVAFGWAWLVLPKRVFATYQSPRRLTIGQDFVLSIWRPKSGSTLGKFVAHVLGQAVFVVITGFLMMEMAAVLWLGYFWAFWFVDV